MALALDGLLFLSIFSVFFSTLSNRGTTVGSPFVYTAIVQIALVGIVLINLVGFIMFVVSTYELGHYYNEPGIFKNIVYAIITAIVGGIVFAIILVALFAKSALSRATAASPSIAAQSAGFAVLGIFGIIGALFVVVLLANIFLRRTFIKLAGKSGVQSFDTAGLLILIGTIIPLVSWIGWIFAASGFNSLKPKPTENSSAYYTSPTAIPIATQNKNCPYCGTANNINAIYCKNCGKQLQ